MLSSGKLLGMGGQVEETPRIILNAKVIKTIGN
jgi:hypothetical protein